MLRVVLPFCRKDHAQMAGLLEWVLELDPDGVNHNCLLSYETGTDPTEISNLANRYFKGDVLDNEYSPPRNSTWPEAPNWAWTRAALFINQLSGTKLPWLWLESDAAPLVSGWLDKLDDEYAKGGKPFMGHIVERPSKYKDRDFDRYMNGVGIYPHDACLHSSRAMRTRLSPWDVTLSDDCIGRVHQANHLIEHVQRFTGVILTCDDAGIFHRMIDRGVVLFHGCNDGSIYSLLRDGTKSGRQYDETKNVVKTLSEKDLNCIFDERESLWQQEAIDLKTKGHPVLPLEELDNRIPSFRDQTQWRTGIFHELEYGPNCVHLNPSVVKDDSGKVWFLSRRWEMISSNRRSSWHSTIQVRGLDYDFDNKLPKFNQYGPTPLEFRSHPMIEHEDPRASFHDGKYHVSYCVWEKERRQSHGSQGFATFDKGWNLIGETFQDYGNNKPKKDIEFESEEDLLKPKWEKNWVWFIHKNEWHVIYSFSPFRIYKAGRQISEPCGIEPKVWKYGAIRGGTPPVFHAGLYWTFFHSSLPWKGRQKRYYMGCYAFNDSFKIMRITHEPLLAGSDRDARMIGGPLVIFPGGAIIENGKWFVVFGVNDEQCGWIEIPHLDLEGKTIECSR